MAVDSPDPSIEIGFSFLMKEFESWEQRFSRFRPDSELSILNHSDGTPVEVSPEFWQILIQARHAEILSQGMITPVIERALEYSGYSSDFLSMEHNQTKDISHEHPYVGRTQDVILEENQHLVRMQPGYQLDFGGVAKGWAASQSVAQLGHYGPALVNAGGDIAISSPRLDGTPWVIGVSDPLQPTENLAYIQVRSGGVATSGTDYRRWKLNSTENHHIIDPRTGYPARTDVLSATVVAPDLMDAEAHAKTVVILGGIEGVAWLDAHSDIAGLCILNDGRILPSKRMNQYLWRENVLV